MKFSLLNIAMTCLATVATASELSRRDGAAVLAGIADIQNQTQALTNVINNFQGEGSEAIGLQATIHDLETAIDDTVKQIQNSANFTDDESTKISMAILTLEPFIKASLDATVKRQPEFDHALPGVVNGIVAADLRVLQQGTDRLGAALLAKFTPTYVKLEPIVQGQIDGYFTSAIQVYATGSNVPGGQPTGNAAARVPVQKFDAYAFGPAVMAVAAFAL